MGISRRVFCQGVVVGAALSAGFSAPAEEPLEVIDTHQHLWDLGKFSLPWLKNNAKLSKNFLTEDYLRDAEGLNVSRAVYMEVAVTPEQKEAEAEWVIELCRAKTGGTVAAVIGGTPTSEGFAAYIGKFKASPWVKGVRSPYAKGLFEQPQYLASLRLLGEMGMSYDLLMNGSLLLEAVKVVDACPGTRFIVDHCGNASTAFFAPGAEKDDALAARRKAWADGIAAMAERPNVICKISGVAESGPADFATVAAMAPIVNHCLDRFGQERVVFASNWPVCLKSVTYRRWVELLNEIVAPRSAAFRRRLFSENAAKFYGV